MPIAARFGQGYRQQIGAVEKGETPKVGHPAGDRHVGEVRNIPSPPRPRMETSLPIRPKGLLGRASMLVPPRRLSAEFIQWPLALRIYEQHLTLVKT